MKCKNCGYENKENAKFCASCGADLSNTYELDSDEEYFEENSFNNKTKKSNKRTIILIVIFFVALVGVGIYVGISRKKNNEVQKLLYTLEIEKSNDNYDKMIEINYNLFGLTKDQKYKDEIDRIKLIKENDKNIKRAEELIDSEEYEKAYKIIMSLKNSKLKDQEQIDMLESNFENSLNERIDDNNSYSVYDNSIKILEGLLKIEPDNEYFKGLLDSVKSADKTYQDFLKEDEKMQKLYDIGENLIGKTIYVTNTTANVRSGPGLSYPVLFSIDKLTPVYVSDYSVDDRGIIWLYCESGWISYKNFT